VFTGTGAAAESTVMPKPREEHRGDFTEYYEALVEIRHDIGITVDHVIIVESFDTAFEAGNAEGHQNARYRDGYQCQYGIIVRSI
jgi:hypothetical protein